MCKGFTLTAHRMIHPCSQAAGPKGESSGRATKNNQHAQFESTTGSLCITPTALRAQRHVRSALHFKAKQCNGPSTPQRQLAMLKHNGDI